MVTCLFKSVPLHTWAVFPTLTEWWLIRRYSFRRRFQWMKTQFCLTFQISFRPYPASSMQRHLSWHTTFRFMNSKLVLHFIFCHTLSKYHPINQTPITSQTISFVTHKYSPKTVCRNQPRKIMMPVCLPWRTIYLTVRWMPCKISLKPCMTLLTVMFTTSTILVIMLNHCTLSLQTPAVTLLV
jgi:hypothetical protein